MIDLLHKSRKVLTRRPSALTILHATSAALNLGFSLAQTLVLARTLDVHTFSELIFLVSAGIFLAPIYQLAARGNYALYVDVRSQSDWRERLVPASGAILLTQVLSVLAAAVASAVLRDPASFLALFAFALYINLSNAWYNEIQTSFFMCGEGMAFSYMSLARRLCSYATLGALLYTRSFSLFCMLMGAQAIVFHAALVWSQRHSDVSAVLLSRGFREPRALFRHVWRSAAVVNVIGAEWMALSLPYLLFTWMFGASVELVMLDTGLKLVRVALTFVRALAEAALPAFTVARSAGNWIAIADEGRRLIVVTLAMAVPFACIIGLYGSQIFRLLLGGQFSVPHDVGPPFALATIFASLLQLALLLVGFFGRGEDMRRLLLSTSVGAIAMVALMLVGPHSLVLGLWALAAHLLVSAWGGVRTMRRALSIKQRG